MSRRVNRIKNKYRGKNCFDMVTYSDEKISKFLDEDPLNFVIEIDKKIFCGNKKDTLTRRTVKNNNLVYLCSRVVNYYNISEHDIVDKIPYLRLDSVGLSQGQILISYNNIIEVIVNSDDQIFICKHMYDHIGNLLYSKSTVDLSIFINKGSVVSGSHCQQGGDYPIYSVYSVTHPNEMNKLNNDFIIPRRIENIDISIIRDDIDKKLGLDITELVYVYFPNSWSDVINDDLKPDYGFSLSEDADKADILDWWNTKENGVYLLGNDLIQIDDTTGREFNYEWTLLDWLERQFYKGNATIEGIKETLEKQVQKPHIIRQNLRDADNMTLEEWINRLAEEPLAEESSAQDLPELQISPIQAADSGDVSNSSESSSEQLNPRRINFGDESVEYIQQDQNQPRDTMDTENEEQVNPDLLEKLTSDRRYRIYTRDNVPVIQQEYTVFLRPRLLYGGYYPIYLVRFDNSIVKIGRFNDGVINLDIEQVEMLTNYPELTPDSIDEEELNEARDDSLDGEELNEARDDSLDGEELNEARDDMETSPSISSPENQYRHVPLPKEELLKVSNYMDQEKVLEYYIDYRNLLYEDYYTESIFASVDDHKVIHSLQKYYMTFTFIMVNLPIFEKLYSLIKKENYRENIQDFEDEIHEFEFRVLKLEDEAGMVVSPDEIEILNNKFSEKLHELVDRSKDLLEIESSLTDLMNNVSNS